jgi:hypothetical protein
LKGTLIKAQPDSGDSFAPKRSRKVHRRRRPRGILRQANKTAPRFLNLCWKRGGRSRQSHESRLGLSDGRHEPSPQAIRHGVDLAFERRYAALKNG